MAGKAYKKDIRVHKIFKGATEERKVYFGNNEVFSSAHDVFYHIDINNVIVLEIEDETDIIAQAPPATKAGWDYVGWRQDGIASGDVLDHLLATEDDMHVYAVFSEPITVSLVGGDALVQNVGTRYYNNGIYNNPWITLGYAQKVGWTVTGYRNDTSADPIVPYVAGRNYEFSQDTTLYAVFQQDVILRVTANGIMTEYPRIRYENNGNYNNPIVYIDDPVLDDADFDGYSDDPNSTTVVTPTLSTGIILEHDEYRYAVWTYHDRQLYSGYKYESRQGEGGIDFFTFDNTKYVRAAIVMKADISLGGWAIETNGTMYISGGWVMSAHRGGPVGTWEEGPCANGATATVTTLDLPVNTSYGLSANVRGDIVSAYIEVYTITGIGRTIVY